MVSLIFPASYSNADFEPSLMMKSNMKQITTREVLIKKGRGRDDIEVCAAP